jgi:hypothetical protein
MTQPPLDVQPSNSDNNQNRIGAECMALYPLVAADIRSAKTDQWSITNYAVAIYAALIAFSNAAGSKAPSRLGLPEKIAFTATAWCTLFAAIYLLAQQTRILRRSRSRLARIQQRLHLETQAILEPEKAQIKMSQTNKLSFFLIGAVVLGFCFVLYSLFGL